MKKGSIPIPKRELVDINSLSVDGENPNLMTKKQREALKQSILRWGFIIPIITNKNLLISDGEQKWEVAKDLKMPQVPIIRLPLKDVDRRILRQVLNKLRGKHDIIKDALEFKLIDEKGAFKDLQTLIAIDKRDLALYQQMLESADLPFLIKTGTDYSVPWRFQGKSDQLVVSFGEYATFLKSELIKKAVEVLRAREHDGFTKQDVIREVCQAIIEGKLS